MPLQDTYTGTARGAMRRGGRFADRAILSASASIERSIGVDLGEAPVHVFDKPSASTGDDAAVFSGLQYIGSYNWIDAHEPTIVVPGSPRLWLGGDVQLPISLQRNMGVMFVDQNTHRNLPFPLLPVFLAADMMEDAGHPKFQWSLVDIISDRNSLRKLLSFLDFDPEDKRSELKDFRIDLQLAGTETIILQRWEDNTLSSAEEHKGYNDAFVEAFTAPAPGCNGATIAGHHRIISYDFDGLKLVVRYEVDAFYRDSHDHSPRSAALDDDLSDALSSLTLSSTSSPASSAPCPPSAPVHGIRVIRGGTVVPQPSLIKLKTRSERSRPLIDWPFIYPQLALGQTPALIVGVHSRGEVHTLRTTKLDAPALEDVRTEVQPRLRRLSKLLEEIWLVVAEIGKETRVSLLCRKGVLSLVERTSGEDLLPQDVLERFEE